MGDFGVLDSDHEGRSGSVGTGADRPCKLLVVIWNQHAEEEDAEAVEEQDPVEGELDRARDGLARVLSLADSDTDKLSAEIGEDGIDERAPKSEEHASASCPFIFPESSGVAVVLEAGGRRGTSANCKEEREQDYANL